LKNKNSIDSVIIDGLSNKPMRKDCRYGLMKVDLLYGDTQSGKGEKKMAKCLEEKKIFYWRWEKKMSEGLSMFQRTGVKPVL
jgi:hypothetical protein